MAQTLFSIQCNDPEEYTQVLFETRWVRALVIQAQNGNQVKIEVELRMVPDIIDSNKNRSVAVLDELMTNLQVYQQLVMIGFEMTILDESCVWSASKVVQSDDLDKTLEALSRLS